MALVDELKKQSGTGAELAQQGAVQRARDFAAGKISQADYAATLGAPNLAYQNNSISAKAVPTPSFSLLPKPEAERQLEARGVLPSARPLTDGIIPAANAATPNGTQQPAVSDAYPDEGQRGAAKTALSQLANVPAQPSVPSLPNGYRVSDTSVSGVKRVDGGSSPLFTNIDPGQAVSEIKGMKSGTGVIGADGSNFSLAGGKLYEGRIVNSGYEGAGVTPNTDPAFRAAATQQFQGAENQRFATSFNEASRKNLGNVPENKDWYPGPSDAFAQQYRVGQDGKLQGYEIDRQGRQYEMGERQRGWNARNEAMNNSPSPYEKEQKERRDLFAKWGVESQLMRVADPAKRAELSMRLQDNLSGQEYRGNALSQLARDKSADRELDAQRIAQAGKYNQSRIALDQQEAGTRALTAGINDRKSQAEMAEIQRLGKLRDAYIAETDPSKKEQIGRALLTLQGKEPDQTKFQVATNEDLIDPSNPMLGTRKTAYVIDPRTGQGRPVVSGNGQQPQIPEGSINFLKANPNLAAQFDAMYGQGASSRYLQ